MQLLVLKKVFHQILQMKSSFLTVVFLMGIQVAIKAQSYHKELLKSYTLTELNAIESKSNSELKMLNYAVEHAVYLIDVPAGKETNFPVLNGDGTSKKFTDYGLKIIDRTQYFRLKNNTKKILVVKSSNILLLEMK